MFVTKRNGNIEEVQFDKITSRINKLVKSEERKYIDPILVAQKVVGSIYSGITTEELDNESAKICINLCTSHHSYSMLAGRIVVSNLHKKTINTFVEKQEMIQNKLNFLDNKWLLWIVENRDSINAMINYERDYLFDYFGFKTLEKGYLTKIGDETIERPQDMFMRVASFINKGNLELIKKTYDLMSLGYYTHASPTLFNSGNNRSQLASCFLLGTDDSIEGITKTWADVAKISKWGGGIGLHVSNIRAKNTMIKGTNGPSSGLIPMLKVFNEIARYIDQCFIGSTKIYTDRGLVPIQLIKPNDKVFTIDGSLQIVERVYCDPYENKILNFKIYHDYENIKVTPSHPFYVIKNQPLLDHKTIINRLNNNSIVPEWIDAKNITSNNLIGFPIPKHTIDNLNLDEADCYFYGIVLNNCLISENNECLMLLNLKKTEMIEFVQKYLTTMGISFLVKIINNKFQIVWTITSKFKFVRSQFYHMNIKHFDDALLHLPEDKSKWVIKAIVDGDKLDTTICTDDEISIEISTEIVDSIKYILLKMGILCSGYLKNNINETVEFLTCILIIPKTEKIAKLFNINENKNLRYIIHNEVLYTRLDKIEEEDIQTNVYDLEIQNNHNYLTQAGLVHNGGKRKGSVAIYLEPHHSDILSFLDLKKNFGAETERARDLFLAVWVSDLFMKQVEADGDWYLMCPDKCPGLTEVYGEKFEELYWLYVKDKKYNTVVKARIVMKAILDSQLETGTPYITFKDHVNNKTNQKNIGTIKSSNLCVHGDTLILTNQGYQNIESLENKEVSIWNGTEWSLVIVKKTGQNKNLVCVKLSNGAFIHCTPEHKFYIGDNTIELEAQELKVNDTLIKLNLPTAFEITENKIYNKNSIPFNLSIKERLTWFQNYCKLKVFCKLTTSNIHIRITDNYLVLLDIRLMLHTLGIESFVIENCGDYDSNEENADDDADDNFYENYDESGYLHINYTNSEKLIALGFDITILNHSNDDKLINVELKTDDIPSFDVKVVSVYKSYENVNTYCFTERKKHMGVFNGILTGQCNEILEYSDSSEYAVCNLASIAINKFIKPFECKKVWKIYTTNGCKYCNWVKTYLEKYNYLFEEETISYDQLKRKSGSESSTYPQIYYGDLLVGGYSDFFQFICGTFNYDELYNIVYTTTINLNNIIDLSFYPVIEAKKSNIRHRPIAIGIQGLADALVLLKIRFDSDESIVFNKKFMETIYLGAITASNDIAKDRYLGMNKLIEYNNAQVLNYTKLPEYYDPLLKIIDQDLNDLYHKIKPNKCELDNEISLHSGAYSSFKGSPISEGLFQFDLWSIDNNLLFYKNKWEILRENIKIYGVRNSLVTALMPTASTSQILGNNECFEYFTNNIYTRRTLAGDFPVVNKYLIDELDNIGLWNNEMKQLILANNGSISNFQNIPIEIRNLYQTIWEIKQIWVLKNAVARGPFVDQTQSMNIFMAVPDYQKLYSSHFWSWKNGLKTGIYYLRSKAAKDATKITVDPNIQKKLESITDEHDVCENCSA
jgi:ribonucleotide reductase alpha subunit